MPNYTANQNFNIFLENEPVDWELINENFEKIDDFAVCEESGVATASYTGGATGTANWRYKKYSDGTIDMSCKIEFVDLRCSFGTESPYYSLTSNAFFPFALSEVYDVQMHLASNTIGWVSNITNNTVTDKVMFRVMSVYAENSELYKQVFINVKGVLA